MSIDEAYGIYDNVMDRLHNGEIRPDWAYALCLSEYEAVAYAWGARFSDLISLRFESWPTACSKCGLSLDYRLYGWMPSHDENERLGLHHIECPEV
jgi:hypothetical protein